MAVQNSDIQNFIASLPRRETRAHKLYWVYTVIVIAASAAWLVYSLAQVKKWQAESARLTTQVTEQRDTLKKIGDELNTKNEELESVAQQLQIPLEELQNLRSFGFLSETGNPSDLHSYAEQSKKIKAELQNIQSPNGQKNRRANLLVRYYLRGSDDWRVQRAMQAVSQDYGFRVHSPDGQKEPNTFTNAIWVIHDNASAEDVKLIAYYLMQRGIQIRYIGPPTSTPNKVRSAPESIWVLAEPKVKDEPPLTVEQIKQLTPASIKQGTKPLG